MPIALGSMSKDSLCIQLEGNKCIYTLKKRNHFLFALIISPLVSIELSSSSLSIFFHIVKVMLDTILHPDNSV